MGLDAVNTKFYSFILYFMLFKERLLEKHCHYFYNYSIYCERQQLFLQHTAHDRSYTLISK